MAKALHCLANDDFQDSYVMKYIALDEVWVDVEALFPTQRLLDSWYWDAICTIQDTHTFAYTGGLLRVELDASSSPDEWSETAQGLFFNAIQNVTANPNTWHTLRYHYKRNNTCEFLYDGTPVGSGADTTNLQTTAVVIGQDKFGAPTWIRQVKIGTTAGASDILLENWVDPTFSQWDVHVMSPNSKVDYDPIGPVSFFLTPTSSEFGYDSGTELFKFTPSSAQVFAAVDSATKRLALTPSGTEHGPTSDAGTELFKLIPDSDEHFCPEKVEFQGDLSNEWEASSGPKWSAGFQSRWEGQYLGIGEGFAC